MKHNIYDAGRDYGSLGGGYCGYQMWKRYMVVTNENMIWWLLDQNEVVSLQGIYLVEDSGLPIGLQGGVYIALRCSHDGLFRCEICDKANITLICIVIIQDNYVIAKFFGSVPLVDFVRICWHT